VIAAEAAVATDVLLLLALVALVGIWLLALVDVVTRRDLPVTHKVLLVVVLALLVPVSVIYVLGRPITGVRRTRRLPDDWRSELVARLEGDGEEARENAELVARVQRSVHPTSR
jgi:hypothetical protein